MKITSTITSTITTAVKPIIRKGFQIGAKPGKIADRCFPDQKKEKAVPKRKKNNNYNIYIIKTNIRSLRSLINLFLSLFPKTEKEKDIKFPINKR